MNYRKNSTAFMIFIQTTFACIMFAIGNKTPAYLIVVNDIIAISLASLAASVSIIYATKNRKITEEFKIWTKLSAAISIVAEFCIQGLLGNSLSELGQTPAVTIGIINGFMTLLIISNIYTEITQSTQTKHKHKKG